jgi:hypothetical protein
MSVDVVPEWMANLDETDLEFVKKFIMASGSLKEMAMDYGVTYPTVRLRLDRLIQNMKISEKTESEPFVGLIKRLAMNEKLDFETAKILITAYKKQMDVS